MNSGVLFILPFAVQHNPELPIGMELKFIGFWFCLRKTIKLCITFVADHSIDKHSNHFTAVGVNITLTQPQEFPLTYVVRHPEWPRTTWLHANQ